MESVKKGETLIPTPKWFIGLRVAQIVVALIIVALSGFLIHGYYADAQGIAIASGIFTWIIALYVILTEHSAACRSGYNTWAILSLDFFMIVLWLASLGANAAYRASFVVPVDADCYDDGSTVNAGHCVIYKREAVAGPTGRAVISAVAGISAINLLLFVATFAYVAHFFRLEWAKHSSDIEKASGVPPPPPSIRPSSTSNNLSGLSNSSNTSLLPIPRRMLPTTHIRPPPIPRKARGMLAPRVSTIKPYPIRYPIKYPTKFTTRQYSTDPKNFLVLKARQLQASRTTLLNKRYMTLLKC